ncbi:hypothetical protein BGZ63DRAFT_384802 [Mariannaea sp. PMI_226]|nr:hypothetical protein BGZ63DRAFT_384802 [Mariannaea sp. PMI_226]
MASRTGSSIPGKGRPLTYGKTARKRQTDAVPLHAAESRAPSLNRPAIATATDEVAKPSKPRPAASVHTSLQIISSPSDSSKARQTQSRDDANSRKRKRPQAASSDTRSENLLTSTSPGCLRSNVFPPRAHSNLSTKTVSSSGSELPRRPKDQEIQKKSSALNRSAQDPIMGPRIRQSRLEATTPSMKRSDTQNSSASERRPRLIDALAAQRPSSPDSDSSTDEEGPTQLSLFSGPATPTHQTPTLNREDSVTRLRARPGVVLQGKRVKFTYGQSRTILNDSQKTTDSGIASSQDDILLATPPELSQPDLFSFDDEDVDEDGDIRPAIKSVHELRRAGANNRFADEMEDLLARIGSPGSAPSSMRRNALLELAQKLQRRDFITQFRDHATRDKVAVNIGQEEDVITGFALTSILITFLKFSPTPHLIPQLAADGLGKMLGRLLLISEDIVELSFQKRMKLSGVSRRSVGEVKSAMALLDIWQGQCPEKLSCQTLALHLLSILCQVDPGYSAGVVKDAKKELTSIMASYVDGDHTHNPNLALVISILESQSTLTMGDDSEVSWILSETPIVARFLSNALLQWSEKPTELQSKILKLAINTSNTARGAAGLNDGVLMSRLSAQICLGFESAQEAVSNRRLRTETYDGLLLILGVMINILEHCEPARETVVGESLESLITLYLQHQASTSEADSVEKSQLSVAVGYLAVLLGYLSLVGTVRRRLVQRTDGEGIRGLIGSIQEFIRMYRSVDSKVHELEGLVNELQQLRRM